MRLVLHGGFGEKGRTCIGVESHGYRLLLDVGVKTSASGRDYYPAISEAALKATDAIVVSHAHEDHVAALGWCIAGGFSGRIFMTPESRRETDSCLAAYALPLHRALAGQSLIEDLPVGPGALRLGPLQISTGRSGHIAGGVWCMVDDGHVRLLYCGDVVPASRVFAMDPALRCSAIAIDASYGDDAIAAGDRVARIIEWIAARPGGCVLPTPLYGRSAELLAVVPGAVSLSPGMRDALRAQIAGSAWLVSGAAEWLARRLDAATDWQPGTPLPRAALLCHDGMGVAGPSRAILEEASARGHPTLFTGHLPNSSPGERLVAEGRAEWIRLPTHPTLPENLDTIAASGATTVLGHSCDHETLARLTRYMPALRSGLATGDSVDL